MKKLIAFILALLMLASVTACAKNDGKDDDKSGPNDETIPEEFKNVDLGGEEFVIACRVRADSGEKITHYSEIIADDLTGDPINDNIYERNQIIESLFNCKISAFEVDVSSTELKTTLLAGNPDEVDAAFVNGVSLNTLLSEDLLYNLLDYDLGLENDWWHNDANDSLTLNGRLYGAVGDFSSRGLVSMAALFFNKTLMERFESLENPYTLVREGRWTIDVLTEYAKTMTDLGGNDTLEIEDRVGFVTEWGSAYYYMAAADVTGFQNNGSSVVFSMNNSNAQSMIVKIAELLNNKLVTKIVVESYNNDYTATGTLSYFSDQKIAFFSNYIYAALELRDMEADFGMLPLPKLNESQENYCSVANRWVSSYAVIPLACETPEMSAIVLNAMAYYGQRMLREAIYDRSFRSLKLLRDEDSVEMFELIIDSQVQDMGLIFSSKVYDTAVTLVKTNPSSFSSTMQKKSSEFEKLVADLHALYGVS